MLGVRLSFASKDRKPAFGRKTAGFCLKLCKIALYKGQINHTTLFKLFLKYSRLDSRFPYNFDRDFTLGCVRLRTFVTKINRLRETHDLGPRLIKQFTCSVVYNSFQNHSGRF